MFKKLKKVIWGKCTRGKSYDSFKKELMAKFKGVQTKQIKDQLSLIIDEAFQYGINCCINESYKLTLKSLEHIIQNEG